MNNVSILDCTLRDGGYVNNWIFGKKNIRSIIEKLEEANIDIIETGFLRNETYNEETTVFSSIKQISKTILPKKNNVLYAAMIEQHNYVDEMVSPYDGSSIDILRLTFRKNEWVDAKKTAQKLKDKGYKVCIQPVGTSTYDDETLLRMLKEVNDLKPFAFYMVDTLGMMYIGDMRRLFYLIDNNLNQDILLGFHSHNNLQMAFANAQEMIQLNHKRKIIIDTSCYGMGRGVGNLATELFVDYINNSIEQRYTLTPILEIVNEYLLQIYNNSKWGYSLPFFLSATAGCHPNYASYLMRKETLSIERIEKVLHLIPFDERSEYNETLIEELYIGMQMCEMNDTITISELKERLTDKEIVILGSGKSIIDFEKKIREISENKMIISINFVPKLFDVNAIFVSNEKRLEDVIKNREHSLLIATSNLKNVLKDAKFVNYSSYLGEGDASDNAGAMLIRVLKKIGIEKLYLAGLDGFSNTKSNYALLGLDRYIDDETAIIKNQIISKQLSQALKGIDYEFITPTKYEISNF